MLMVRAYAKINLTLDVLGKRPDGYHLVDTILQSVDLSDDIQLEKRHEGIEIRVAGDAPADESNLACRAARLLQSRAGTQQGASIHIEKRIPVAAGLAGGSADAAAALLGLNRLWNLHLPMAALLELAAQLGADVPFCLTGGTVRGQGIGTELTPLSPMPGCWLALCKPCEGMLTKDVFSALPLGELDAYRPNTERAIVALNAGDLPALCAAGGNVLEAVTLSRRPQAKMAMNALARHGALSTRMSGSGPSVYGVFQRESDAKRAIQALPATAFSALVRPCAQGCQLIHSAY